MVPEILLLSVICGIFGSNLVAVPEIGYSPEETLVLECGVNQGVRSITLYDHDSDVFKPWHNVADCEELRFKGVVLEVAAGEWKGADSIQFLRCPIEHMICDMFNPASPYRKLIHINYVKMMGGSYHALECPGEGYFSFGNSNNAVIASYSNIPIISTKDCSYFILSSNEIVFKDTIKLGTLTSGAKGFTNNGNEIFVTKPAINNVVAQGHRYIFKIAVRSMGSFICAIDACLKSHSDGECIDYQIYVRGKGNLDWINFPISKNSIQNDAYVEINLWDITFWNDEILVSLHGELFLKVSHRVNERILEQYRGKIFRKETKKDIVDVHVLECEDGDISCDTDGRRNFKLTIYGVADSGDISYFNIQGVKINSGFDCNSELSLCSVTAFMEKHRHTTLEYRTEGTFLALIMADSDSYTAIFKDSSITAVADEDT